MRIAVGADHAGFELKQGLAELLRGLGHEVNDVGTHSEERCDYPDFGAAIGRAVTSGQSELGVGVCGSGIGIAIAANKVAGVRAATVHDVTSARLAREHNDAHIISMGGRFTDIPTGCAIADAFLATAFSGDERHARRLAMVSDFELGGALPEG